MQQINSIAELKDSIQLLELERDYQNRVLKDYFLVVTTNFKPENLLISSINGDNTSNLLIDNLIDSTIGLASGFITKKLIIGKSDNKFRILLGSVFQLVATNFIAKHHNTIESLGKFLLQSFLKRNKS
jgi:hypothetical protein